MKYIPESISLHIINLILLGYVNCEFITIRYPIRDSFTNLFLVFDRLLNRKMIHVEQKAIKVMHELP